ncbi:hypothetical protein [Bradyrhizobium sp.]|uniref:hypothetical protein n=1 Tax=Bradyrhizobium sp. TaxID=376 RepID=UPI0026113A82|nr:hypothetical protein [Bradyrhizobium sp.]
MATVGAATAEATHDGRTPSSRAVDHFRPANGAKIDLLIGRGERSYQSAHIANNPEFPEFSVFRGPAVTGGAGSQLFGAQSRDDFLIVLYLAVTARWMVVLENGSFDGLRASST